MAGGNAEDKIRIGRKAEPDRTLGGEGNTGKIAGTIEKVENNLKMKVRRPAAVFASVADMGEDFAAGNALADSQRRERCGGEMAVESEEVDTGCRGVMKDDDGAVIERRGVIREHVDGGAKRGGDGSARFDEKDRDRDERCGARQTDWWRRRSEVRSKAGEPRCSGRCRPRRSRRREGLATAGRARVRRGAWDRTRETCWRR
jgi:hypothetical protein